MYGIQPAPLSTETIFGFGCRSRKRDIRMFAMTRRLLMNSIIPPIASFCGSE